MRFLVFLIVFFIFCTVVFSQSTLLSIQNIPEREIIKETKDKGMVTTNSKETGRPYEFDWGAFAGGFATSVILDTTAAPIKEKLEEWYKKIVEEVSEFLSDFWNTIRQK